MLDFKEIPINVIEVDIGIEVPVFKNGKKAKANVFSCDAIVRCEGVTALATDLLIESFGPNQKE